MKTQIALKRTAIEGNGWRQIWYDVFRNGVEIGTAFAQKDGGYSFETDDDHPPLFFRTLKEVKAHAAGTPISLVEEAAARGLL